MIELLGLPACGKSTFSATYKSKHPKVINPLEDAIMSGSRFRQNANKILPLLWFWLHCPRIAMSIFPVVVTMNYVNLYERVKMFVYLYTCLGLIQNSKRNSPTGKIIFDEGVCQTLWGVAYSIRDYKKPIGKLFDILTPLVADEIIWFPIDRDVVLERMKQRTGKGGAKLQRDILKDESHIDYAIECILYVKKLAEEQGIQINTVSYD